MIAPGYRFAGKIKVTDWPYINDEWPNWKYKEPISTQMELMR